jgi:hypothetical protein
VRKATGDSFFKAFYEFLLKKILINNSYLVGLEVQKNLPIKRTACLAKVAGVGTKKEGCLNLLSFVVT